MCTGKRCDTSCLQNQQVNNPDNISRDYRAPASAHVGYGALGRQARTCSLGQHVLHGAGTAFAHHLNFQRNLQQTSKSGAALYASIGAAWIEAIPGIRGQHLRHCAT